MIKAIPAMTECYGAANVDGVLALMQPGYISEEKSGPEDEYDTDQREKFARHKHANGGGWAIREKTWCSREVRPFI